MYQFFKYENKFFLLYFVIIYPKRNNKRRKNYNTRELKKIRII